MSKPTHSRFTLLLTASVAALGGLLFGYDTSVISGAMLFLRREFHLSDNQLEFAVAIALAGALAGSAVAGYSADRWGRRKVLIATGIGFGVFAILSGMATGLVTFCIARFFVGFSIGLASLVSPLYIAEVSPPKTRGALVTLNQLAITVGIAVAYFVDHALASTENWRWMFITAVFPSIALLAGMVYLPESPRWWVRMGQRARALATFERLGQGAEAETEVRDVEQALLEETGGFGLLFQPGFRIAVLIGVGVAIFSQITGINTIIYYSPMIFRMAGYPSDKAAILAAAIIGVADVLITIVSILLVDRLGRRRLLLIGTAGMAVALVLVGSSFYWHTSGIVLYEVIAYTTFFGVSLGPVSWLLLSEIYPTKIRGKAMSLGTLSIWGANWVVAETFLSLVHAAGPAGTFWIFAAMCVVAFVFCYALVPETKGKSLEEIERYWRHLEEKTAL
jgi:sugar porter (SP) family MFS transporter